MRSSDSKGDPKESALLAQKWTSDSTILAEIGDFTSAGNAVQAALFALHGVCVQSTDGII